jgi:hypothetical protein
MHLLWYSYRTSQKAVMNYFKRGITCLTTKLSSAKIAARNSPSQQVSRNFTKKKALQMSLSAAKHAETHAKAAATAVPARCMMQFAHHAVQPAKFPLSPATTDPFIAVIVSADDN